MWDRIVNFVYNFVRDLSNATFCIIMAILVTFGFYCIGQFLKANKKEEAKVNQVSKLILAILMIVLVITLANIRY